MRYDIPAGHCLITWKNDAKRTVAVHFVAELVTIPDGIVHVQIIHRPFCSIGVHVATGGYSAWGGGYDGLKATLTARDTCYRGTVDVPPGSAIAVENLGRGPVTAKVRV